MATTIIVIELFVVLAFIFIGARVGGLGLGIYGMLGTFILVYGFGLAPGKAPIDVMLIIVIVQVAMTFIGGRLLRTAPLTLTEWGVVVVFALSIIVVDLLRKFISGNLKA